MTKSPHPLLRYLLIITGLAIFAYGNFFFRTFMTNFDERDHLATGFLMSQGKVLYKDIFSHHFPLPYYWVTFWNFLWVNQTPHRGIAMFRTTLTIYYLFCALLVLPHLKKFSHQLLFIFFLITLIPLMPLFHGNILLSDTFGFFPVIMLIWLLYSGLTDNLHHSRFLAVSSAILCSLAFWSQPLLIFVFILPIFFVKSYCNLYLKSCLIFLLFPILGFISNHSFSDFWYMAIIFNWQIYPRYYLDIVTPLSLSVNPILLSQLIGTSFLICLIAYLFLKKHFRILFFLILTLIFTLLRLPKIIPGQLFNFGILPLMMFFNLVFSPSLCQITAKFRLFVILPFALYLFFLFQAATPIISQTLDSGYNYRVFWSNREAVGQEINRLTSPSDPILVYPHDVDLYYLAKRLPPDRFLYWFPWINAVPIYRTERQLSITQKRARILFLGDMNFKNQPDYYLQFFPNLTEGYLQATTEGKFSHLWQIPQK